MPHRPCVERTACLGIAGATPFSLDISTFFAGCDDVEVPPNPAPIRLVLTPDSEDGFWRDFCL